MSVFTPEAESPFAGFRFQVNFLQQGSRVSLARGAFSECSGLEATMEPEVIKEGGRNYGPAQRVGPVTFAEVALKRGLTSNWDLWKWFYKVAGGSFAYRLDVEITILGPGDPDRSPPRFVWKLERCLPTKFKAPDLDAASDQIAVEELHLVHEGLWLVESGGAG
ncbi:MAG TPA: phage tail protein [Enhygromyxa sp.]|nr:phage tail protein [Enhygromyxa sp.]